MTELTCGFIGAGRMATALARGFVSAGLMPGASIVASDPHQPTAAQFAQVTGGRIVHDNAAVASAARIVFLAVKPQHLDPVLADLHGRLNEKHLVISIVAGVPLSRLAERLGGSPRLVRVMPNTPCLVGQGASGYALGRGAGPDDAAMVERLLGATGRAYKLEERLLDAVTGLSGSGPAYAFVMIEALADGGVRMGLPRDVAQSLAAQTMLGAAQMVLSTGEHPAALKDQVASPGGTTIAGLAALEAGGVRAALIAAVEAATLRSKELGKT